MTKKKPASLSSSLLARKGSAVPSRLDPLFEEGSDADQRDMISLSRALPGGMEPEPVDPDQLEDEEEQTTMADVLSASPQAPSETASQAKAVPMGFSVSKEAAEGPDPLLAVDTTGEVEKAQRAPKPEATRPSAIATTSSNPPSAANQEEPPQSERTDSPIPKDSAVVNMHSKTSESVGERNTEPENKGTPEAERLTEKDNTDDEQPVRLATYEPRGLDNQSHKPQRKKIGAVPLTAGVLGLAAFAVVSWFAYNTGVQKGDEATEQVVITPATPSNPLPDRIVPETGEKRGPTVADNKPIEGTAVVASTSPAAESGTKPAEQQAVLPGDKETANRKPTAAASTSQVTVKPVSPKPPSVPASSSVSTPVQTVKATPVSPVEKSTPEAAANVSASTPVTPKAGVALPAKEAQVSKPALLPSAKPQARVSKPQAKPALPKAEVLAALSPAAGQTDGVKGNPTSPFVVQMASVRSEAAAKAEWARLRKVHGELLSSASLDVQQATVKNKGTFYRIRAAGLESRAAARALCDKLKAARQSCLVVRR